MKKIILCVLAMLLIIPSVYAVANLEVTAFACNPNEVVANNQFSCTATVQNTGDATGTLNTATLYPDANNWMEKTNYPETVNTNINSGASTEITFSGLKGKKSGNNGFSKIMLDDVTDTYAADNAVKVNVIDVVGIVTTSSSSAALGSSVTVTGQATAGGNVDIALTFSVSSGGCSIGNQPATATANEMTNGQTTSHTWTVTMGSANCVYSVAAKATSNPSGTASKTDTTSNTITCTNCPTSSESTSTTGGGGGGGGGTTTNATANVTKTTQCTDGIDNDNDGLIDLKDPGCESVEDNRELDIVCKQSWNCSEWSDCLNNRQTRICIDANNCLSKKATGSVDKAIEVPKPEEVLECTSEKALIEVPQIIKDYGVWIAAFVLIAGILGYLYYHGHHHVREAKKFIYKYKL